jgi:hypothetical protein
VREDYSENGDAWNFFTHDHARSRAYRWGEDGLAGISDDKQRLCFALAVWNGKDPILLSPTIEHAVAVAIGTISFLSLERPTRRCTPSHRRHARPVRRGPWSES